LVKIDRHISDLLQDHDCVIVPKMGGFLSSQAPKGIYSARTNNITPKISFNVLLKYNDGLLANHIAKNEMLSYNQALEEIERFVDAFQKEVNAGKKFIIERVGTLYKDEESVVQIEPYKTISVMQNNSGDAASMAKPEIENVQQTFDRPPVIPLALPVKRKRSFFKSNIFVFILFLSGIIYVFYLFEYSNSHQQKDLQTMDSVDLMQEENSQANKNNVSPPAESKSATEAPSNKTATGANKNINPIVTTPPVSKTVQPKDNNADVAIKPADKKPATSQPNSLGPFFIIAGSFKSIENANSKMNELKSFGFSNAAIFLDKRNLQMVSYDQFKTAEEAAAFLKTIKSEHKDAWVYKRES
jgi:hypothetical protein